MDKIICERMRKSEKIIEMYTRKYRQKDIAEKFGVSIGNVGKVTKAYGFEHGKEKSANNPNNLNEGQAVSPLINYGEMGYLDKYDF